MITSDSIIKAVCQVLELDRDKLLKSLKANDTKTGKYSTGKYAYASYISAYLIRQKVLVPKSSKNLGTTLKPPTYKQIAEIFNRKAHWTVMNWEIECKNNIRDNKEFKLKYELVLNKLNEKI